MGEIVEHKGSEENKITREVGQQSACPGPVRFYWVVADGDQPTDGEQQVHGQPAGGGGLPSTVSTQQLTSPGEQGGRPAP